MTQTPEHYIILEAYSDNDFGYWMTYDGSDADCSSRFSDTSKEDFLKAACAELLDGNHPFEKEFIVDLTEQYNSDGTRRILSIEESQKMATYCIRFINHGTPDAPECNNMVQPVSMLLKFAQASLINNRLTTPRACIIEIIQSARQFKQGIDVVEFDVNDASYMNTRYHSVFNSIPDIVLKKSNIKRTDKNLEIMINYDLSEIDIDGDTVTDNKINLEPFELIPEYK